MYGDSANLTWSQQTRLNLDLEGASDKKQYVYVEPQKWIHVTQRGAGVKMVSC